MESISNCGGDLCLPNKSLCLLAAKWVFCVLGKLSESLTLGLRCPLTPMLERLVTQAGNLMRAMQLLGGGRSVSR